MALSCGLRDMTDRQPGVTSDVVTPGDPAHLRRTSFHGVPGTTNATVATLGSVLPKIGSNTAGPTGSRSGGSVPTAAASRVFGPPRPGARVRPSRLARRRGDARRVENPATSPIDGCCDSATVVSGPVRVAGTSHEDRRPRRRIRCRFAVGATRSLRPAVPRNRRAASGDVRRGRTSPTFWNSPGRCTLTLAHRSRRPPTRLSPPTDRRTDPVDLLEGRRSSASAICSIEPRGVSGWAAADVQYHPPPGALVALASGVPSTAESAPHAIALARSPEVLMSPSASTCTYRPPVSSR